MHDSSPAEYDKLPYEGHPDPMIHPDRMASMAWLHGVESAKLEEARILEIGCATGAHLIPMAYQLPEAKFVGFDYSPKQIEMARLAAAAVGLNNIRFELRDIRDDHQQLGEFDYILAHGVFSWVPRAIQDALFEICQQHLAPNGVALIDYNVFPGWHLREFFHDLVLYHQHDNPDLATATNEALNSLDYVASHLFAPASPFGQSVGHLQRWAKAQPKNYLAHEFGGAPSHPISFCEFAERTKSKGLQILGDAEITHVVPAQFTDSLAARLDEVAGPNYVRREQYLDFLRGRDFRRTLLVREGVTISRPALPTALQRLRVTTMARKESASEGAVFRCPDGTILQTVNRPLILALSALCNKGSAGMTFDALYQSGCSDPGAMATTTVETFAATFLEVVAGGLIQLHAHSPRVVNYVSEKPLANAVARAATQAGQETVTSMLQRDWSIDHFECSLLCLLDGTHERQELAAILMQQIERGEIVPNAQRLTTRDDLRQYVEAHLSSSLQWFAHVGMLVG